HEQEVTGVAVSPDGKLAVSCGKDGTVRVWDLEAGVEKTQVKNVPLQVQAIAWSPRGDRVLLGGGAEDGGKKPVTLREWDPTPGSATRGIPQEAAVRCLAFLPDGKSAVVAGGSDADKDYALYLWSWTEGKESRLTGHTDEVLSLAVSADGKRAFTC